MFASTEDGGEEADAEEATEADPEQRGEGDVAERRGQDEVDLDLPVERPRRRGVREREGNRRGRRDGEEEEDRPRPRRAQPIVVFVAHPVEAGPEAAEFVPRVRHATGVLRRRRQRVRHGERVLRSAPRADL